MNFTCCIPNDDAMITGTDKIKLCLSYMTETMEHK